MPGKQNVIVTKTDKGFTPQVTVNSLDELISLSEQYDSLIREKQKETIAPANENTSYYKKILKDLGNIGIKFPSINVLFSKDARGNLGHAETNKDNKIILSTDMQYGSVSPLKVVLHEHVHILTMRNLDKHSDLKQRVRNLMDHVIKQANHLENTYGFTNEQEFLAEVISDLDLQEVLHTLKPVQ